MFTEIGNEDLDTPVFQIKTPKEDHSALSDSLK
jgi:hypothetical protein